MGLSIRPTGGSNGAPLAHAGQEDLPDLRGKAVGAGRRGRAVGLVRLPGRVLLPEDGDPVTVDAGQMSLTVKQPDGRDLAARPRRRAVAGDEETARPARLGRGSCR